MENQPINYREEITKALSFIPDAYLASLYHIIELIAKPFRKQEEEEKEEAQQQVTPEILQHYADTFRKGFKILMKEGLGLNVSYQIRENCTILNLSRVAIEDEKQAIHSTEFDLEVILTKNHLTLIEEQSFKEEDVKYKIRSLNEDDNFVDEHSEKASIFDPEEGIYLVDISQPKKWTEEQAIIDRKNLIGLMFQNLPTIS